MSRGLKFVRQVVGQVRMSNEDFDNDERIKTEDVRNSASAVVEIRRLKAENEAQVRISSLEHDLVEIEGLHDGVQELADAQAQVTEVKEAMESYLEKGGMTRDAARFAEIAMKNITSRVFMPVSIPSLESFTGSSADRTDMTIVSMEAADSWYVKVWEAIKNFFKKIIDKVKSWFGKSKEDSKKTQDDLNARITEVEEMIADKENAKKKFGVKASDIKNGVELGVLAGNVKITSDGLKKEQAATVKDGGDPRETAGIIGDARDLQTTAGSSIAANSFDQLLKDLKIDVKISDTLYGHKDGSVMIVGGATPVLIREIKDGKSYLSFAKCEAEDKTEEYKKDKVVALSDYLGYLKEYQKVIDFIIGVEEKLEQRSSNFQRDIDAAETKALAEAENLKKADKQEAAKKAATERKEVATEALKVATSQNGAALMIVNAKKAINFMVNKCGVEVEAK